jgi:hypothetical protein
VREERSTHHRSRHDLCRLDHRRWQDVEQVLREAPDGGGMTEQLVRIQVQPSVIAVPEIEVAVQHQHLVLLQVFERLFSYLVATTHIHS